jgi:hypothetical protein
VASKSVCCALKSSLRPGMQASTSRNAPKADKDGTRVSPNELLVNVGVQHVVNKHLFVVLCAALRPNRAHQIKKGRRTQKPQSTRKRYLSQAHSVVLILPLFPHAAAGRRLRSANQLALRRDG